MKVRTLWPGGVTLIEVTMSFAIMSIAVVLFAPVLLDVRENSRSNQCKANMRNLTMGVLQFEGANQALPAAAFVNDVRAQTTPFVCADVGMLSGFGVVSVTNGCFDIMGRNPGPNYSWITSVLPFAGEEDLYDLIDFKIRVQDHFPPARKFGSEGTTTNTLPVDNTPVFARQIRAYVCPADGGTKENYDGSGSVGGMSIVAKRGGLAKTNYATFTSPVHIDHFIDAPGALGGFEVGSRTGQRLSQIADGASRTLLLSEVRARDVAFDSRGVWALAFPGSSVISVDHHSISLAWPYTPDPLWSDSATPNALDYADLVIGLSSAEHGRMPGRGLSQGGGFLGAAARSRHIGGVFVSAVDGQVGFMSNDIDSITLAYLVHTRDGQDTDFDEWTSDGPATLDGP